MVDASGSSTLTHMITAQRPLEPMQQRTHTPEAIAHRGVRDRYPENSLPAFTAALDEGADAVELDVHATADGVVVVHHDAQLSRTAASPLAGRSIVALSAQEIAEFELSPGVVIPTLQDVLRAVTPSAGVYIEIKAPGIETMVAAVIAGVPSAREKCAVHSFDHRIARNFASLMPSVPAGILVVGYPVDSVAVLNAAAARDLWESCEFVDTDLIEAAHAANKRIVAWTCNDPEEWDRLSDLGVDGICTDRVGALVFRQRSE